MNDVRRFTDDLQRSLQRRASSVAPLPAAMDQVVHRARVIRRRRRTAVSAAVVAAVAAIAVPAGVMLGSGPEASPPVGPAQSDSPAPARSQTPSPSPSATASSPAPDQTPSTLTLEQITPGGSVDTGWLEGTTWHNGQGDTQTIPSGSYAAITPYHGGFLVAAAHASNGALSGAVADVTWLDNTLQPQWTACGGGRFAVSGDQQLTAYSRLSDCTPQAVDTLHVGVGSGMAEGETTRQLSAGQLAEPVGMTDQVLVYNRLGLADGSGGGAWYTNLAQPQAPRQVPGLARASSVNASRQQVAGDSAADPQTGMVVDPVTGKVAWSRPDWGLGQFSPDGTYVVAAHSAGGEPDQYAILDATDGHDVTSVDLTVHGMQVVATAWNPDDSLLLLVHQGDQQAIVRLTPSGTVTRATDVMPADAAHRVVFATQP